MYVYVDRAVAALARAVGRQRLVTDIQIVTDMYNEHIVGYMYIYVDRAEAALARGVGRQRLVTDTQIVTDMSTDG